MRGLLIEAALNLGITAIFIYFLVTYGFLSAVLLSVAMLLSAAMVIRPWMGQIRRTGDTP